MDALEWGEYLMKQRYEWMNMLLKMIGADKDEPEKKSCSNEIICSMCGKTCKARVSPLTIH